MGLFRKKEPSKTKEGIPKSRGRKARKGMPTAREWNSFDSDDKFDEMSRVSRYSVQEEDELSSEGNHNDKYSNLGIERLWSDSVDSQGVRSPQKKDAATQKVPTHISTNVSPKTHNKKQKKATKENSSTTSKRQDRDISRETESAKETGKGSDGIVPTAEVKSEVSGKKNESKSMKKDGSKSSKKDELKSVKKDKQGEEESSTKKKPSRQRRKKGTKAAPKVSSNFGQQISTTASIDVKLDDKDGKLGVAVSEAPLSPSLPEQDTVNRTAQEEPSSEEFSPVESLKSSSGSFELIEAVETVYEEDESESEDVEEPKESRGFRNRFVNKGKKSKPEGTPNPPKSGFLSPKKVATSESVEKANDTSQNIEEKPVEKSELNSGPNFEAVEQKDVKDVERLEAMVASLSQEVRTLAEDKKKLESKLQKEGSPRKERRGRSRSPGKRTGETEPQTAKNNKSTETAPERSEKAPKSTTGGKRFSLFKGGKKSSSDSSRDIIKSQSSISRVSAEEKKNMYSQSLMNIDSIDSVDQPETETPLYEAERVGKTFDRELDEFPNAQAHGYSDGDPALVQCLNFYYCGSAAKCTDKVYKKVECNPREQVAEELTRGVIDGDKMRSKSAAAGKFTQEEPTATDRSPLDEQDDDVRDDGSMSRVDGIDHVDSIELLNEAPAILPSLSRTNSFVRDVTQMHLSLDVDSDDMDAEPSALEKAKRQSNREDETKAAVEADSKASTVPTRKEKKKFLNRFRKKQQAAAE